MTEIKGHYPQVCPCGRCNERIPYFGNYSIFYPEICDSIAMIRGGPRMGPMMPGLWVRCDRKMGHKGRHKNRSHTQIGMRKNGDLHGIEKSRYSWTGRDRGGRWKLNY